MPTPLILHHGLFGYGRLRLGPLELSYFHKLDEALGASERPVLLTHVHPTASIERRAGQLKRAIMGYLHEKNLSRERVMILAHSLGGLDARYMVSRMDMADRVAAVVTISTPHQGTAYADWCFRNLTRTGALRVFDYLGLDLSAVKDLTRQAGERFNEKVPDVPGVGYFSVSAARPWHRITPLLIPSWRIVCQEEGDNDGLVSVASAGHGAHLGTWPLDHWHIINRGFNLERKRQDVRPLYRKLLDRLRADRVIDQA